MDDRVVPDEGIKRRLPLWMLSDQAMSKSETVNLNNISDDDKGTKDDGQRFKKRGRKPKSKSREEGNDDGNLKLKEESSSLLIKHQERKRTKKGVISHDADLNDEVARNKRKRRGKTKQGFQIESDGDVEGCSEKGEDDDLTVEDLMSIAKEYVREDNDAQAVVSSKQRQVANNQSEDITQSGSSLSVTEPDGRLFESHETSSCSMTRNLTSEIASVKPALSGNPAEDMLDLFLGPLLKKTQELREKESRLITEETGFAYEVRKQHSSIDLEEEPVVVMKKKSSLKDKVAMFLE